MLLLVPIERTLMILPKVLLPTVQELAVYLGLSYVCRWWGKSSLEDDSLVSYSGVQSLQKDSCYSGIPATGLHFAIDTASVPVWGTCLGQPTGKLHQTTFIPISFLSSAFFSFSILSLFPWENNRFKNGDRQKTVGFGWERVRCIP